MGVATAAGIGAAGTVAGGIMAADGARKASQAADRASIEWRGMVERNKKEALASYDEYSPARQASLDKAMAAQQQDIGRQQALVDSINPALLEAGKQTKQLLDGQSAPILNQMKDQRAVQRQALIDNLRQQVGPGAETSTLGQNQLQKFDAETAAQLSGAQQQYLQQVSGLALSGNNSLSANIGSATNNLRGLADSYGQIGKDRAGIIQNAGQQAGGAYASAIQTAGADGQHQAMTGQLISNLGNSVIQGAAAYYGGSGGAGKQSGAGTGDATTTNDFGSDNSTNSLTMPNLGSQYGSPAGGNQYSLMNTVSAPAARSVGSYGGAGAAPQAIAYSGPLSPGYGAGYDPTAYKPFSPKY